MSPITITLGTIGVLISAVAWFMFGSGVWRMVSVIRNGQPDPTRWGPFFPRLKQLLIEFAAHTRMVKFRTVGWAHWLVMIGFLAGFILYFEAYGQTFNPNFSWPIFGDWPVYHLMDELLGIGTVVGILVLIVIRQLNHPRRADRMSRFSGSMFGAAYTIEAIVLLEGLGMVMVKAGKIAMNDESHPATDFFTMQVANLLPASPELVSAFAFVKMVSGSVFLYLVGRNLTWGVAWHRFSAFFNIYFKRVVGPGVALGAARPMMSGGKVLDMEEADPDNDAFGAGKIEDFTWKGWLDFTTCTECGRCQSQCPAWNTGKPLSPKLLITSLRDHGYAKAPYLLAGGRKDAGGDEVGLSEEAVAALPESVRNEAERPLVGESDGVAGGGVIDPETLWSCTTCGACVEQCPVDIEHVDHIIDMRRYQVLIESEFPSELAGLFKNLETKGNPWGQNAKDRTNWINEVDFDVDVFGEDADSFENYEYLFWVGCAGAYEDRAKKTTKAVAELLSIAGVKFLVLGAEETCTGDPARRAGNEFLFQQLAQQNVEVLGSLFEGVEDAKRKIVVTCPHCFNTLGNEYSQVGGNYTVLHHTQLLNRLVRDKKLVPVAPIAQDVTYHDPCYLGRHNKVYEAPRELVGASGAKLTEMPRHGERSMCCGAGGARMWMEEKLGKRINIDRVDEALGTDPAKIATGCPFCRVMMTDGVTARQESGAGEGVEVIDVAQLLLVSVTNGQTVLPAKKSDEETATAAATAAEAEAEVDSALVEEPATEEHTEKSPAEEAAPPKAVTGLGIAGGAKKPGAKKAPAAEAKTDAAPTDAAPTDDKPTDDKPTETAKPVKGLGLAGGAKKPGAKKAPAAAAKPEPAAEPSKAAAEPSKAAAVTQQAPVKGLGIAAGARRPGARKSVPKARATPEPEPEPEAKPAATASDGNGSAPREEPADGPPVVGLGLARGARPPGRKR
ncbi:MAG: (Fe-S)-binding protein [Mycobacterium sp.]